MPLRARGPYRRLSERDMSHSYIPRGEGEGTESAKNAKNAKNAKKRETEKP